jgi:hypothetical protein
MAHPTLDPLRRQFQKKQIDNKIKGFTSIYPEPSWRGTRQNPAASPYPNRQPLDVTPSSYSEAKFAELASFICFLEE